MFYWPPPSPKKLQNKHPTKQSQSTTTTSTPPVLPLNLQYHIIKLALLPYITDTLHPLTLLVSPTEPLDRQHEFTNLALRLASVSRSWLNFIALLAELRKDVVHAEELLIVRSAGHVRWGECRGKPGSYYGNGPYTMCWKCDLAERLWFETRDVKIQLDLIRQGSLDVAAWRRERRERRGRKGWGRWWRLLVCGCFGRGGGWKELR